MTINKKIKIQSLLSRFFITIITVLSVSFFLFTAFFAFAKAILRDETMNLLNSGYWDASSSGDLTLSKIAYVIFGVWGGLVLLTIIAYSIIKACAFKIGKSNKVLALAPSALSCAAITILIGLANNNKITSLEAFEELGATSELLGGRGWESLFYINPFTNLLSVDDLSIYFWIGVSISGICIVSVLIQVILFLFRIFTRTNLKLNKINSMISIKKENRLAKKSMDEIDSKTSDDLVEISEVVD